MDVLIFCYLNPKVLIYTIQPSLSFSDRFVTLAAMFLFAQLYLFLFVSVIVSADSDNIVINFGTGFVDGVPLPGDLASLVFTTDVGRTIAQILELNITAQGDSKTVISREDTSHPCYKWLVLSFRESRFY